jgi:hypothetical protein
MINVHKLLTTLIKTATDLLMTAMHPHNPNPLTVAQESMKMGKESGDRYFKFIALAMMAATGLATLLHGVHVVWRDMREDRRNARDDRRHPPRVDAPHAEHGTEEPDPRSHDERSWVHKARLTERPDGERRRAEQRADHGR